MTDAVLQTDRASPSPSVASTGRSWEYVPSETSAMRQGPYSPAPKAQAQAAASSSSTAAPSATVVTAATLMSMFGPSKAEKLDALVTELSYLETHFIYWMLSLSFLVTVLLVIMGCWVVYHRLPARRPRNIRPFLSRLLRRCRAVPSFFSY